VSSTVSAAFLAARARAEEAEPELEDALAAAFAEARAAWPEIALADTTFAHNLGARAPAELAPTAALRALRTTDLYLAIACAAGDDAAAAVFERSFAPVIRAALAQLRIAPADRDDLCQQLHEKLFVGNGAKIADYAGRGPLRSWVRAAATRVGLNFLDRRQRETPLTGEVLRALPTTGDPALDRLRDAHRAQFQAAFRLALRELSARQRTLLAQAFIDGLNVDELGAIHGVHRATAARWLVAAREAVLLGTKATLRAELKLTRDELDSLMRLVDSQLEFSVGALLAG
jgi:RNA polymerase sigma-70 factor, ECF subfamily